MPTTNILLLSVHQWDTKEAGVAPKTLLSKFNMTLTNEDLNRLQEGEELNNQVTV